MAPFRPGFIGGLADESADAELPVAEALDFFYEACAEGRREFSYGEGVTLRTVHSAKGAEYDHVVLVGAWPAKPDQARQEEERRTFYVGMTRAKKSLAIIQRLDIRPSLTAELSGPAFLIRDIPTPSQVEPEALLNYGTLGWKTFDMPTLMGYDSDHAALAGRGRARGVAIDSLEDMETLFDGIPLGEVSTSMTINSPAAILLAFYVCVGDEQGVPRTELSGTVQTDILKEYIAQKEYIYPPEPSMRLVVDMIEYCSRELPRMHPISISGYHIREAGSTAAQELAFTLADGFAYVDAAVERGLDVDDFAPRLSFFFNAHIDFFEEIAIPRRPADLGARAQRQVRREEPALVADALPHPDRRLSPTWQQPT